VIRAAEFSHRSDRATQAAASGFGLSARQFSSASGVSSKGMSSSAQSGNESELIAAIVAGDTALYHRLIRPYERSVYMMSLSYVKNKTDAEDVAQEAFIKAFYNLADFRGESKFSTWLISIALNEARSRLRRQAALRIISLDELQDDSAARPVLLHHWQTLPPDEVEREEVRNLLQQAVDKLPDIYREVFLLRDVEEFDINETAQMMGISTSLVKVRLHRARMMLQRLLAPRLKMAAGASKSMQLQEK
jgi:RNA polymerase sigma-70 factor, ECF subfamily